MEQTEVVDYLPGRKHDNQRKRLEAKKLQETIGMLKESGLEYAFNI